MRRIALLVVMAMATSCGAAASPSTTSATVTTTTSTSTTSAAEALAMATDTSVPGPLELASSAFEDGQPIPARYTCDGEDVSPPLQITGLPLGTESLVIVIEDPDAAMGTWDHWVEFDIPAAPRELEIPEGAQGLGVGGRNSWNVTGYMGPCPPEGEEHRYFITVYALRGLLELPAEVDSATVREALEPLVIESAELMGIYAR